MLALLCQESLNNAFEPLLGGGVNDDPRQGDLAALADARVLQSQRQRVGVDHSTAESRPAPGQVRGGHSPG